MNLAVRMLAGAIFKMVEASGYYAVQHGQPLPDGRRLDLEDIAAADEVVSEVLEILADTSPIVRH